MIRKLLIIPVAVIGITGCGDPKSDCSKFSLERPEHGIGAAPCPEPGGCLSPEFVENGYQYPVPVSPTEEQQ